MMGLTMNALDSDGLTHVGVPLMRAGGPLYRVSMIMVR